MSRELLEEYIETGDAIALAELLKSSPALVHETTSHSVSPLMLSCYYKKPAITKLILEYIRNPNLFEAAAAGKFDSVAHHISKQPEQINSFSDDGFTPLGLAAYFGHEEVVRYLLLKGAEVNLPSQNGFRVFPLHSAAASDYTMIVKMLLEAGAEVNVAQQSGATPLHSAAQNGNIELIILLLEAGASVSARMEGGKLPGDLAAERGFTDIAKILVP